LGGRLVGWLEDPTTKNSGGRGGKVPKPRQRSRKKGATTQLVSQSTGEDALQLALNSHFFAATLLAIMFITSFLHHHLPVWSVLLFFGGLVWDSSPQVTPKLKSLPPCFLLWSANKESVFWV
jgi:hypothetical protein